MKEIPNKKYANLRKLIKLIVDIEAPPDNQLASIPNLDDARWRLLSIEIIVQN
jgi:hypothetical protein